MPGFGNRGPVFLSVRCEAILSSTCPPLTPAVVVTVEVPAHHIPAAVHPLAEIALLPEYVAGTASASSERLR